MRIHPVAVIAFAASLGAGAATVPAIHADRLPALSASARARVHKGAIKTHQATGEVVSVSGGGFLLLHARGRTEQRMAFVLTPQTRKETGIMKGARIIVYYHEDNGRRIAVRIRSAARRSTHSIPVRKKTKH